jgi:hypothetical protein
MGESCRLTVPELPVAKNDGPEVESPIAGAQVLAQDIWDAHVRERGAHIREIDNGPEVEGGVKA